MSPGISRTMSANIRDPVFLQAMFKITVTGGCVLQGLSRPVSFYNLILQ